MLWAGFFMIVPVLALAGNLAEKEAGPGRARAVFPVAGLTFVVLLVGTILIVGALTFFPALSLGPVVEHFLMTRSAMLYYDKEQIMAAKTHSLFDTAILVPAACRVL